MTVMNIGMFSNYKISIYNTIRFILLWINVCTAPREGGGGGGGGGRDG